LEIATRAQVSKRELYTLFGSKQAILAACTAYRGQRMRLPPEVPVSRTHAELAEVLTRLGSTLLIEICDPRVVGVFRLAITEVQAAPEVALTLNETRHAVRNAVHEVLTKAHAAGLLGGDPDQMTGEFFALLFGDLQMSLLLRLREAPTQAEAQSRAQQATAVLLRLHPAT
jgi:AcrR family transcriptional regulator